MKIRAHDTFYLRRGWLHKGIKNICTNPKLFTRSDVNPCDALGIGKNMVKSLRYWMDAVGVMDEVAEGSQRLQRMSRLGSIINQYDPYYEEDGTNWIIHYMLAKNENQATAWYWFFNIFRVNTFDKELFVKELGEFLYTNYDYSCSPKMLSDEFNCLINTYCAKGRTVNPEDMMECPLVDLRLVEMVNNRDYKKCIPDKDSIHPLIILAVIEDQASNAEILIQDLLSKPCNVGKILNLDRATCFYYLEQLQKMGEIKVVRTAGLDVVKLKNSKDFYDIIQRYYKEINGVAEL